MSSKESTIKSFTQRVYIHALVRELHISTDVIAKILDVPCQMIDEAYAGKIILDNDLSFKLFKLIAIYANRSWNV